LAWTKKEKLKTAISGLVIITLLSTAYLLSSKENPGNTPISLMIGVSLGLLLERGRFCFFCIYREGIEDKNTTPFLSILLQLQVGQSVTQLSSVNFYQTLLLTAFRQPLTLAQ